MDEAMEAALDGLDQQMTAREMWRKGRALEHEWAGKKGPEADAKMAEAKRLQLEAMRLERG